MSTEWEVRVRARAYAIWEAEGQPHGRHEDHWHRAAREITGEDAASAPRPRRATSAKAAPQPSSPQAKKPSPARPAAAAPSKAAPSKAAPPGR
ncbi:MAG TPA: DUF2934 domain-containing protein [Stellaceae bacterium]|nr:DUF2934 domain-containing protein [Stellaceae bacterium]